jgi:hypothetical protein
MTDDRGQKTDDRGQKTDDRGQKTDDGGQNMEVGILKSEAGPVVVPKGGDYAAASMRKWEKKEGEKVGSWEGGKLGEGTNRF